MANEANEWESANINRRHLAARDVKVAYYTDSTIEFL